LAVFQYWAIQIQLPGYLIASLPGKTPIEISESHCTDHEKAICGARAPNHKYNFSELTHISLDVWFIDTV